MAKHLRAGKYKKKAIAESTSPKIFGSSGQIRSGNTQEVKNRIISGVGLSFSDDIDQIQKTS